MTEVARSLDAETLRGLTAAAPVIPASVEHVIDKRLASAPPGVLALLETAAVVGREFTLPLLNAALPSDAEGTPPSSGLDWAVELRIVTLGDRPDTFVLAHDLVASVLRAGLAPSRLARLHERTAESRVRGGPPAV